MYVPRVVGIGLAVLPVGTAIYQEHGSVWLYPLLLLMGLVWPHVAYQWASRSDRPAATEFRNLRLDSVICGFWVPIIGFSLAPTVLIVTLQVMGNAMVGGTRLLRQTVVALLIGLALGAVVSGIHPHLISSALIRLACAPFILLYPTTLGIMVGTFRSQEARDQARASQHEAETRLAALLASSPTVLYAMEHDGKAWRCVEVTTNLERLVGFTPQEALAAGWWAGHVHPEDHDLARQATSRVLLGERVSCHYRIMHKAGGYRWLRDELELLPATLDQPARIIGAWLDITEQQQAQEDIHRLAFFDTLTGLANRRLLQEHLTKCFIAARQTGHVGGLMSIDLDGFKTINDVHGHVVGDQVLIEVGKRLIANLRASDTVARVAGDEFIVLLPNLGRDQEEATARAVGLAKKLSAAIDERVSVGGAQVLATASIGISVFPNHGATFADILREADIAMYAAKATNNDRLWSGDLANIAVFEIAMQDTVTQRHQMQIAIRTALDEQRFELWLQRQVDVDGGVIGAEALIRLRHADGSLIPPNDFIPIAEENGLIVPIGQWVRVEACRLLATIDAVQLPRLSINVSAIEFRQPCFADEILDVLAAAKVDPQRLVVEITESLLIDRLDDTIVKLQKLSAHGIGISIDDFGTGYSSLAYLQRLPITEIKIDRRFIRDMLTDLRSARLTQSLIMLARHLGFDVIAEGVETEEQMAFLRLHDCTWMQGFYFGRPEPATHYMAAMMLGSEPG
jgi:diguanylate cyclase (GGDEF)-like protein/PAS domain S-box-containing protein